jgi:hypothetical protein
MAVATASARRVSSPLWSSIPAHSTAARSSDGKPPRRWVRKRKPRPPAAISSKRARTAVTASGRAAPRNASVTW